MAKITIEKNIPKCGDIVDDVKYNKNKTMGCIIFDSGKKIYFDMEGSTQTQPQSKEPIKQSKNSKREINPVLKNTHEDLDYMNKAKEALSRMGVDVNSIRQSVDMNSNIPSEEFEEQKRKALEQSEKRSRQLSEQLSLKSGGKVYSDNDITNH